MSRLSAIGRAIALNRMYCAVEQKSVFFLSPMTKTEESMHKSSDKMITLHGHIRSVNDKRTRSDETGRAERTGESL